jgi:hypothetical protein
MLLKLNIVNYCVKSATKIEKVQQIFFLNMIIEVFRLHSFPSICTVILDPNYLIISSILLTVLITIVLFYM